MRTIVKVLIISLLLVSSAYSFGFNFGGSKFGANDFGQGKWGGEVLIDTYWNTSYSDTGDWNTAYGTDWNLPYNTELP